MVHADRRETQTRESYVADDLEALREAPRYAAHVIDLFRADVGRRVLEVGSGIGTVTVPLLALADRVVGIEPNPSCVARLPQAVRQHPRFVLWDGPLDAYGRDVLRAERFDTVVCINVLEHMADDVGAMAAFREAIVPGGKVVIFVPAVPAAYGPLDEELGHFRRYSKASLSEVFGRAELELLRLRYTNPIGLAGWMFNSHVTRARRHSLAQIHLFERLVAPWALPMERWITPPIGQSLIAVGHRPA